MNKRKVPTGSKQSWEKVFDNIQDDQNLNLKKRLDRLFDHFGLVLDFSEGVDKGNNFSASVTGSGNEQLSITAGRALTKSGDHIEFSSFSEDYSTHGLTNGQYLVKLSYDLSTSEPVTVMTGFVFDQSGSEDYSTRNTKLSDDYSVELVPVEITISDTLDTLTDTEVGLAIVQVQDGVFDTSAWSFDGQDSENGVIDIRRQNRLLLNSRLFDETVFFFKDRNNVEGQAIATDTEFSGDLFYHHLKPKEGGLVEAINVLTDEIEMSSGNEKNTNIAGTTSENFYIDVGNPDHPEGFLVATSDGDLTAPSNLRIFDIDPAPSRYEGYSIVTFKWNWSELDATKNSSTEIEVGNTAFTGEPVDLSTAVGKRFYFSNSSNSYLITGVSSGASSYILTLEEPSTASDSISSTNPGAVIDENVRDYILSVKDVNNHEVDVKRLDESFVYNPTISMRLQLGERYSVTMQSLNQGNRSQIVSMPSGEYYPYIEDGLDPFEEYSSEFKNRLPNIPPEGDIELSADAQGFIIQTDGWVDEEDSSKSAHRYEILYSSDTTITPSSFDSLTSGLKERDFMETRMKHVSSGSPKKYSVGVRPLQNGQPVGPPAIKDVTSGGGGILPTEQVIVTVPIDIEVNEVIVDNPDPDPAIPEEYEIHWERPDTGNRSIRAPHIAAGEFMTRLDADGNPVHNDTYRINEHLAYDTTNVDIQRVRMPSKPVISTAEKLKTGISKEGRKIAERKIDIDYRITKIEFDITSASYLDGNNSGIIRVFQKGLEGSGAKMEVPGYQESTITQDTVDLPIRQSSDGTRIIVIDGWDPDNDSPNNECEFSGTLTIIGRPYVSDRLGE